MRIRARANMRIPRVSEYSHARVLVCGRFGDRMKVRAENFQFISGESDDAGGANLTTGLDRALGDGALHPRNWKVQQSRQFAETHHVSVVAGFGNGDAHGMT